MKLKSVHDECLFSSIPQISDFRAHSALTIRSVKGGKCSNANFNRRMFPHLTNNFRQAAGENSDQGLASARCIILHGLKLTFHNG